MAKSCAQVMRSRNGELKKAKPGSALSASVNPVVMVAMDAGLATANQVHAYKNAGNGP